MRIDDIISELKPVYPWVDFERERSKILGWLSDKPNRKLTKRFVVNWLNKIQEPGEGEAPVKTRFVTREMVEEYCERIKWPKLTKYAWGRLMGSTFYGTPITNDFDFESAMEVIQDEYVKRPE